MALGNAYGMSSRDYLLDIANNKTPGTTSINKFGYNSDIDTATVPETIWNGPTPLWVPPTCLFRSALCN